jgi:hypothetical protein
MPTWRALFAGDEKESFSPLDWLKPAVLSAYLRCWGTLER